MSLKMSNACIDINPKMIEPIFRPMLTNEHMTQIYFGGSSSGKSYSMFSLVPGMMLAGNNILVIRDTATSGSSSTWNEITGAIYEQGLDKYCKINHTRKEIVSKISKGSISLKGAQYPERLKSIVSPTRQSYNKIIIEEATDITDEETYNLITSRQRGNPEFPITVTLIFNPVFKTHWIYKRFFKAIELTHDFNKDDCRVYDSEDLYICKSTYLDNPHNSPVVHKRMMDYMKNSPYSFNVLAKGNWGVLGKLVFEHNTTFVDKLPEHIKNLPWRAGIDHGFNDPMTFVLSKYDATNNKIYIVDCIKESEAQISAFSERIKKAMNLHDVPTNLIITADSNDARSNVDLKKYGITVIKAKSKALGAGGKSKFPGLRWMMEQEIIIPNYLHEYKEAVSIYTWKKDSHGNYIDETNHTGSDLIDATRYSMEKDMIKTSPTFGRW